MTDTNTTKILEAIVAWHEEDRRTTVKRTFALGDMLVSAVIHTGMTEYEIIRRVIADLGSLAMGVTSYNRAARMSRIFTRNQRKVLTDHAVSLCRCEILAGAAYEGRPRIQIINKIKTGKITSPWTEIRGRGKKRVTFSPEESDIGTVIDIRPWTEKGDLNEDGITDGLSIS